MTLLQTIAMHVHDFSAIAPATIQPLRFSFMRKSYYRESAKPFANYVNNIAFILHASTGLVSTRKQTLPDNSLDFSAIAFHDVGPILPCALI
jgi:hypothetical protein